MTTVLSSENALSFDGATFVDCLDGVRLTKQIAVVRHILFGGGWFTVQEIQELAKKKFNLYISENCVQAQCRNLRKEEFGKYKVPGKSFAVKVNGETIQVYKYCLKPKWFSDQLAPAVVEKVPDVEVTDCYVRIREGVRLPYDEWVALNNKALGMGFKKMSNRYWKK